MSVPNENGTHSNTAILYVVVLHNYEPKLVEQIQILDKLCKITISTMPNENLCYWTPVNQL